MPRGDIIKKFGVEWVSHFEKGKYDLAILHLDQQCITDALWERGKGNVYRELDKQIDVPKIVIMHGTPYYPEEFDSDSEVVERVKEIIGDNIMVVNSHRAREQWGFGHTIIHGLDPNDWLDLPKEPRVITMLSPAGLDKYYDRTFLSAIREELEERDINHCHITIDVSFNNFNDYREFLGRSLIYINPTRESPMPRARTEAMLSGCCVLTTPHQDADTFIKDGKNGFLIKRNPVIVANLVEELINDYQRVIRVGQEGKKTAQKLFGVERFNKEWTDLINKTLKI